LPQNVNVYEGLFIFDSARYNRDPEGVSHQTPALIEKLGGEILVSRLWEERRLAYSIKGQRKGTYWLLYFRLDSQQLVEIRHQCAINDNILRVLFLKVDPRIVDALVTHAKSAVTLAPTAEAEAQAEMPAAVAVAPPEESAVPGETETAEKA
jgi:small subunit ribosomal protein S6